MINIVKNKKLLAFYTKSINYLCLVENKKQQFKVEGFSKLSKKEKIEWLNNNYLFKDKNSIKTIEKYWISDQNFQKIHDEFTENTISNFIIPLGIAPNFIIDGVDYCIPMAIEESSVVAAACKAAKFWSLRGGFKTKIIDFKKTGQVHFIFNGNKEKLKDFFKKIKPLLLKDCKNISFNMKKRGGGILDLVLLDKTNDIKDYYQIEATFDTVDSMGANFINSCLEQFSKTLKNEFKISDSFSKNGEQIEIIMSILSNYVPKCLVRAEVSCPITELGNFKNISAEIFAKKFDQALKIAKTQTERAVTHNKGIMNGVDSVVIATGNDFRAVEAGVHAYASRDGYYRSLSDVCINDGVFKFWIELPLSLGTVGGITNLHPLVKWSLNLLKNPNGKELMRIVAVAGLAQNFGALQSLITSGIQKGHMKMHLINILNSLNASEFEKSKMIDHFKNDTVSYSAVKNELFKIRNENL